MTRGNKPMGVDMSDESSCGTLSQKKSLVPVPVSGGSSGEGLPYAPEGWPCPGDVWRWKVGNRSTASGYWADRYLYPPIRCQKAAGSKLGFPSRLSVEQYVQKEFPDTDVNAFFSSFVWRIPCANIAPRKDANRNIYSYVSPRSLDVNGHSGSESAIRDGDCKAGNKMCSLQVKARRHVFAAKACDICCSEAGFCRDCCCILCCRTIDWTYGGYSFIRCESTLNENHICGHVAHIECALRSYMAGTVGGIIGLDVEYYCRRCDNKTDLISHVTKLIRTCESLDSQDDISKILNLGLCILRGSEQMKAKDLRSRIAFFMPKLNRGAHLDDWKVKNNILTPAAGDISYLANKIPTPRSVAIASDTSINDSITEVESSHGNDSIDGKSQRPVYITSDRSNVSVKLEDEIDEVLQELKKSQESEYRIAEQKLYARKDILLSLYQKLDAARSALANPTSSPSGGEYDALLTNVLDMVDRIKQEEVKLRHMMKIGKGFGQAPIGVLTEYFGLLNAE